MKNLKQYFCSSLLNFRDVRKSCLLLLTWQHAGIPSSTINVHFQRTMQCVINLCLFKELYFSDAFYSKRIRATAVSNSEKLFNHLTCRHYLVSHGISTAKLLYSILTRKPLRREIIL